MRTPYTKVLVFTPQFESYSAEKLARVNETWLGWAFVAPGTIIAATFLYVSLYPPTQPCTRSVTQIQPNPNRFSDASSFKSPPFPVSPTELPMFPMRSQTSSPANSTPRKSSILSRFLPHQSNSDTFSRSGSSGSIASKARHVLSAARRTELTRLQSDASIKDSLELAEAGNR